MAGVRLQVGKGACYFTNKPRGQAVLDSRGGQNRNIVHGYSAWTARSGEGQEGGVNGGHSPPKRAAAGAPRRCHAAVKLLRGGRDDGAGKDSPGSKPYVEDSVLFLPHRTCSSRGQASCQAELPSAQCSGRATRQPGRFMFVRSYSGHNASYEPLYKSKTGYYDVLELSRNATQAQIKTAYYKQSFLYHPDKNSGSTEAPLRFSDISEAYKVLGNKSLRKKYDLGLLNQSDLVGAARPSGGDAASSKDKRAGPGRHSATGLDCHKVFDFDKYIKSHYGEQLQRQREMRERKEMLEKTGAGVGEKKLGRMMEVTVGMLLAMAAALVFSISAGN